MRILATLALLTLPIQSDAFCGFYVAKADSSLFNETSRVVLARTGDHTVVTMANDYVGDLAEFAMVVPVPAVIGREDVRVLDTALIDRVDDFTSPRLVEYFDEPPCTQPSAKEIFGGPIGRPTPESKPKKLREEIDHGVTVEASYTVDEYEVVVLSATQSTGLQQWLVGEGYQVPQAATSVLDSYIKQGLHFFVARVSVQGLESTQELRPLQVSFDSPRFGLPIRLGTVNARGDQDLLLYVLSDSGRVETTNYRTARIPTDLAVPEIAQYEFGDFYRDMFAQTVRNNSDAVVLEYSWPFSTKCDPCTVQVMSPKEKELLGAPAAKHITRLHVRYNSTTFPEDLKLQDTGDRTTFQGRYPVTHPYKGPAECPQAKSYYDGVRARQSIEVSNMATMTGRSEDAIWDAMDWVPPTGAPQRGSGPSLWPFGESPLP